MRELFDSFDKDNNGSLSECEVRKGLFNLGRNPTEKDIKDILSELGIKQGKPPWPRDNKTFFMLNSAGHEI